jgi:hypothetical protein
VSELAIALVHYPVLDRDGGVVTTAITNLDLHDLARSGRTYGASATFIVHPIEAQRLLAERVRDHWVQGSGRRRIPDRAEALERLCVVASLEDTYEALGGRAAIEVWTTAASARGGELTSHADARRRLREASRPTLILFGTGWGLPLAIVQAADVRLSPICAAAETGYNHLSVRAACAITLDRLLGASAPSMEGP